MWIAGTGNYMGIGKEWIFETKNLLQGKCNDIWTVQMVVCVCVLSLIHI